MLIALDGLGKRFGPRWLFRSASLTLRAGDRVGLVGPNGAGKSTLLRLIAREEPADEGRMTCARGARVARLRQEIDPRQTRSVQAEAALALHGLDELETELRALETRMAELGQSGAPLPSALVERYDHASALFEHAGGFEREARVARVLAGLGFDEEARERPLASFSGGWLMRVELAKLFLLEPEVLLLDEPTNHLDLPAIRWFEEAIADFAGAVLVVSHDRTFLRRHVRRVLELDGRGGCTLYEADWAHYLIQREERRHQQRARKANQDREIAQLERFVERFRAKASKARQVQSRIKALDRMQRVEVSPRPAAGLGLRIPEPPRSGELVLRIANGRKAYAGKVVYGGVDFELHRGEKVALAGPNGAGKSTLLRLVTGALELDSGEHTLGHNVRMAYFAQHQLEALDSERSVLEEVGHDAHFDDIPRLRGHLGAFLFSADDVDKKIAILSGGEKTRVALAKLLLRPANLIVLDEPTNHLDIESCEVLEAALRAYRGTLLFVSHDRSFINALATRVVEVRHGRLRDFSGNYDDYTYRLAREQQAVPTRARRNAPATESRSPREQRRLERDRRNAEQRTRRRIERIQEEITRHEQEISQLTERMAEPEVCSDAATLQAIQAERSQIEAALGPLYRDWEELEATLLPPAKGD